MNDDSLTTSSGSLTTPERPRKAVLVQEGNEHMRAAPAKAILHHLGDHPTGGATHKGRASGADMQTRVMEGYAESASEESCGEREAPEQDRMRTPRRATSQGAAIMGQSPGTLALQGIVQRETGVAPRGRPLVRASEEVQIVGQIPAGSGGNGSHVNRPFCGAPA